MTNFRERKAGPGGYNDIYWNRVALAELIGGWTQDNEPSRKTIQEKTIKVGIKATAIDFENQVIRLHDTQTDDDYTLYYDYDNNGNAHIYELAIN